VTCFNIGDYRQATSPPSILETNSQNNAQSVESTKTYVPIAESGASLDY